MRATPIATALLLVLGCKVDEAKPPPLPVKQFTNPVHSEPADVMMKGCISGSREPLEATYASVAINAGSDPEYSKAEATFAFDKSEGILRESCQCLIDAIGGARVIAEAAAKRGVKIPDYIQTELSALPPERLQACVDPGIAKLKDVMPSAEEIEAFKKSYAAAHPK